MIPVFFILNVWLAWVDATRINKNKFIDHTYNAFIYSCFLGLAYYIRPDWVMIIGLFLFRIPVFNTSLNFFRDLPLTYIPKSPKSIIDKIINPIINLIGYWVFNLFVFFLAIYLIIFDLLKPETL